MSSTTPGRLCGSSAAGPTHAIPSPPVRMAAVFHTSDPVQTRPIVVSRALVPPHPPPQPCRPPPVPSPRPPPAPGQIRPVRQPLPQVAARTLVTPDNGRFLLTGGISSGRHRGALRTGQLGRQAWRDTRGQLGAVRR